MKLMNHIINLIKKINFKNTYNKEYYQKYSLKIN